MERRLWPACHGPVRQNAAMNRLALFLFVLLIAGCGTPPNQVISLRDGTFRAPFYDQAISYCQKDGLTASILGRAQAENGIVFACK